MKAGASRHFIAFAAYLGGTALCCALTWWFLALWRADFRIPFTYGVGDELTLAMAAKSLIENPWIFHNPRLGMPFGSVMFNYPQPDIFHILVLKLIALMTGQFGRVMNLFYLLTFPATFLCSLYVLRRFRIGYGAALLGSLLYAFLPYHFLRGEEHLFLAAYYFVPFLVLLIFRVGSDQPPFVEQRERRGPRFVWRNGTSLLTILVCVIAGASGIYYAFFACFFVLITGLAVAAARRRLSSLVSALIVAGLITTSVLVCLSPHMLFQNRKMAGRAPGDAETYGLKITQMLLPISGHRLPALAVLKNNYYHNAAAANDNDAAALGIIASGGFVLLFCWLTFRSLGGRVRWLTNDDQQSLSLAGILTVAATLLATIGGFGSLVAMLISPQIRSYNRISVFIAFFALLAVALLLDRGIGARLTTLRSKIAYGAGLAILTAIGLLDQTTPVFIPDYRATAAAFRADEAFMQKLGAAVESGAMIFQLPYLAYPDAARYDHARGYLHSRNLRWSYGAMRNERSDLWQRDVQARPVPQMIQALVAAGFSGICLDRRLSPDNGTAMEQELASMLGVLPMVSPEAGLSFFKLPANKAFPPDSSP